MDGVSALIRKCSPKNIEQWRKYYFENAKQKKKDGIRINEEYISNLGKRLFTELSTTVKSELDSITEQECIDYMFNLVINRTYEGYKSEIETIYGELQEILDVEIQPASDEWDRTYNVDYFIEINGKFIGLQIKPIESGISLNDYQWAAMHEKAHKAFREKFGGEVFFIYSVKSGSKKVIQNREVIDEIKKEVVRLRKN